MKKIHAMPGTLLKSTHHACLLVISLAVLSLYPAHAFSAAGDVINNTATINFSYQGTSFTQESSPIGNTQDGVGNGAPTVVIEDQVINFSVASIDVAAVDVVANETDAFLTFTVTNNGNATQDFLLAAVDTTPSPFPGPVDNFDLAASLRVFVENGLQAGYQSSGANQDTGLIIDNLSYLAPNNVATVYVVADIPAAAVGDLSAVALVVQVATSAGAALTSDDNNNTSPAGTYSNGAVNVGAGTPNNSLNTAGVDIVFGDPGSADAEDVDSTGVPNTDVISNGQHADAGAFLVQPGTAGAVDPIAKTVTVIDTLGGTDPHAGATLRYQLVVTTTGAATVDDLVITDSIPANTTYTTDSITLNGVPQTDVIDDPVDYSQFDGTQIIVDLSEGSTVSISTATTNTIVFDVTID
jgi:uncharacterized repeat protein (TIGR01451 family)